MKGRFRFLVAVLVALVACVPMLARADVPTISVQFSISGTANTPDIPLSGQNSCGIQFTSIGSGATVTAQGALDQVPTYSQTVTGFGTAGVITNPSVTSYVAGLGAQALTHFHFAFTGVTGTYAGTVTCGGADAVSNGQLSGTVAITAASPVPVGAILTNNPCTSGTLLNHAINISTATTDYIALSSGKSIYVCKLLIMAAGTTNVTLEYSTSATCASALTAYSGPMPLAAQVGWLEPSGVAANYTTPASDSFCIVSSAAVQLSGHILYVQQ